MFKWIKSFLDRLAKSNAETFNNQRPDCCTLNRNEKQKK